MHSDFPPALVFPDTHEGRIDAKMADPQDVAEKGFCPLYREEHYRMPDSNQYRRRCDRRDFTGDRTHSWCHRCMCGYIMLTPEESRAYERLGTRTEAIRL